MSLELKKKPCTISHINVRAEKHGEESVTAVDITVNADMPNTFLDDLSKGLRSAPTVPKARVPVKPRTSMPTTLPCCATRRSGACLSGPR